MGITYGPITPFVVTGEAGPFVAGARCPDFLLSRPDGKQSFFYGVFEYGKFVVLLPSNIRLELTHERKSHVLVWRFSQDSKRETQIIIGEEKELFTTKFDLGKEGETAIVIRPDLYVGYCGTKPDEYFKGMSA
jgi:hypothetical protein